MIGPWIGATAAGFLLAFAGATTGSSPQPGVADLLARHHRAIGALPFVGATWSGTISQRGVDAQYVTFADKDGRYRTTLTLPLAQRSRGSDGNVEWVQDENGGVQTGPLQRRHSLASLLLGYNAVLFDSGITWSVDGTASMDGHTAYRLKTQFGRTPAIFYLDAATALLDAVEIGDHAVHYAAYQTFGRITLPARIVESDRDQNVTTTVDKVEFRVQLASDFTVPQIRKPDFPAGKSDVAVNFDAPHGLIEVQGAINDHPVKFLLDSGSSSSLIDLAAANRLGLPTGGSSRVAAAGMLSGKIARADTLSVAGIQFHAFVLQAVPLQLPGQIERAGIDGILGFDVLSRVVLRVSYSRGQLHFIAPEAFTYSGTGVILPLDLAERVPRIKAVLGDNDPVTLSVDTGSDTGLILYEDFANAHFRDLGPASSSIDPPTLREDVGSARGAGGHFAIRTTTVNRLALGNFSLADVYTEVLLNPTGAFTQSKSTDGILGGGVLSRFSATFLDYPGGRLILEK
jgi:predicted aspartyl protease